jgi:hypothetical protein
MPDPRAGERRDCGKRRRRVGGGRRGPRPIAGAAGAGTGDRGRPGGAGRVGQGTGGDRVLPAAPACRLRRARGRPGHVPQRGAADRQRLRIDRVGGVGPRRARLAACAVPAAGGRGGLGRRPGRADVVLLRADRQGTRRARRAPIDRAVELLLRMRPCPLGAARRDRRRRRWQPGRLPHVPAADQRVRDRRRLGHRRAARHREQRHRRGRRLRAGAPVAQLHRRVPLHLPGGLRVDDRTWVTRETTAISLWGHRFGGPDGGSPGTP